MIVDLAKIFPKACLQGGIKDIFIETKNITKLDSHSIANSEQFIIEVGKAQYFFTAIDQGYGKGMDLLSSLYLAERMINYYQSLPTNFAGKPAIRNAIKMSQETIDEFAPKVCPTKSTLRLGN